MKRRHSAHKPPLSIPLSSSPQHCDKVRVPLTFSALEACAPSTGVTRQHQLNYYKVHTEAVKHRLTHQMAPVARGDGDKRKRSECTADLCHLEINPLRCYLGYIQLHHTTGIYHPVRILGNDCPRSLASRYARQGWSIC